MHIIAHFVKKHIFAHFRTFLLFEPPYFGIAHTDLCDNILEHFSFRASADVPKNVLKCFKQKTTFLHIFVHLILCHISVHFEFSHNRVCFSIFSMCIFPKMLFYVEKCAKNVILCAFQTQQKQQKQQKNSNMNNKNV